MVAVSHAAVVAVDVAHLPRKRDEDLREAHAARNYGHGIPNTTERRTIKGIVQLWIQLSKSLVMTVLNSYRVYSWEF